MQLLLDVFQYKDPIARGLATAGVHDVYDDVYDDVYFIHLISVRTSDFPLVHIPQ